ncbi:hypothetical protein SprV_0401407000 [Sparganum proliferum]
MLGLRNSVQRQGLSLVSELKARTLFPFSSGSTDSSEYRGFSVRSEREVLGDLKNGRQDFKATSPSELEGADTLYLESVGPETAVEVFKPLVEFAGSTKVDKRKTQSRPGLIITRHNKPSMWAYNRARSRNTEAPPKMIHFGDAPDQSRSRPRVLEEVFERPACRSDGDERQLRLRQYSGCDNFGRRGWEAQKKADLSMEPPAAGFLRTSACLLNHRPNGIILSKFRRKRNEVRAVIRRSRKEYETRVLERAVDKPKVLFGYINSRLKDKETILVLKGENNEDIIENDAKAEHLSRFFVSVFTDETDFDEAGLPAGTTNEIIENIDFTEEDVRKELLALKEKTDGAPLRPIVPLKGTLTYGLAKWLFRRLKFLTAESDTTVSSSARLLEKLKGDLAIETIELLQQSEYDETENRLGHGQVLQLLKFCLRTYFTFDGTIYEQVKGIPMSLPISGFIDEAVLQRLESLVFQNHRPKFSTPYVDDTFVVIDRDQSLTFKERLNAVISDI